MDEVRQNSRSVPVAQLSSEMRVAVARLARRLRAEKADDEMSAGQFSVLATLYREGPLTLRELSDLERVTPPSMTRTVNSLAEAGYVSRKGSDEDGRKVLLSATDAGGELVVATRRKRNAWLYHRLIELPAAERALLTQATTIIRELADS